MQFDSALLSPRSLVLYSGRAKREGVQALLDDVSSWSVWIVRLLLLDFLIATFASLLRLLSGRQHSEPSSAHYAVPCRASPTRFGANYESRSYKLSSKIAAMFWLAESQSNSERKFSWGYVSRVIGLRQSVATYAFIQEN